MKALPPYRYLGWTTTEWDDLHQAIAGATWQDHGPAIDQWLSSTHRFHTPVTPAQVRAVFNRWPTRTVPFLTAMAAGASQRFLNALLDQSPDQDLNNITAQDLSVRWDLACQYPLSETHATGWAAVGVFSDHSAIPIGWWVERFGPDAYLYVMAGISTVEAAGMKAAGTTPGKEQLKVMASLAGHTPPA